MKSVISVVLESGKLDTEVRGERGERSMLLLERVDLSYGRMENMWAFHWRETYICSCEWRV